MNRKLFSVALSLLIGLLLVTALVSAQGPNPPGAQAAVGTGFTYQGQLTQSGAPADGAYDFEFSLWDDATAGSQIGATLTRTIAVSKGVFTTLLDFGPQAFNGQARYLLVRVKPGGGGGSYTTLTPRQPLSAAPYAHSLRPGALVSGTIENAGILNLSNDGGNGSGVRVDSAAGTGFFVNSATEGVGVGSADTGVFVNSATYNGVSLGSVGTGVNVVRATQMGVRVRSAQIGFMVDSATSDGVYVSSAGTSGVRVESATTGVHVQSATTGVNVESAGKGVNVSSAQIGFMVDSAGSTGLLVNSSVAGVYVGATRFGVYVQGPAIEYAGLFNGNLRVTGTCTGCAIATFGVNTGDRSLQPGDVVALQGARSGERIGQPLLIEVGQVTQSGAPVVGVVYGRGELVTGVEELEDQPAVHLVPREGAARAGEYVHIVIYGPMQVKASALDSAIQIGDKLASDSGGAARSLQTRLLEGMRITESAPTIGMALEGLEAGKDGLIWVLVNPQ